MSAAEQELELEAEAHRANVDRLIGELRGRLSPGKAAGDFLRSAAGRDVARKVAGQAMRNPLPLATICAGAAWLMLGDTMRGRHPKPRTNDNEESPRSSRASGLFAGPRRAFQSASDTAARIKRMPSDAVHNIRDRASDLASNASAAVRQRKDSAMENVRQAGASASDAAMSAANKAGRAAADFAQKAGGRIGDAADTAGRTASAVCKRTNEMTQNATDRLSGTATQAGSGIGRLTREQPLLVAGVGLLLGVALGALIPMTRTEHELMGESADRARDRAGDLASEGYDKAKTVAQRSYEAARETAKSEAENQGLTGSKRGAVADGGDRGAGAYGH